MSSRYQVIFQLGKIAGCHQRADRSFFVKGKQFPVCARCTGVLIGYCIGSVLFCFYRFPVWLNILFCAIMFVDWLIQSIGWKESTNIRRLITGIICGIGWMQLFLTILMIIKKHLS